MTAVNPVPRRGSVSALILATLSFTLCFATWILNGTLVTYLTATQIFTFTETQVGWLIGAPILTGALSRVPLGILADRWGGRLVFGLVMLVSAAGLVGLSYSQGYSSFLLMSFAFGLAGGSFAVGIGYLAAFFEKHQQGTALGAFGMGNAGAGLTSLVAPYLLDLFIAGSGPEGWRALPRCYAAALGLAGVVFFLVAPAQPRSPVVHTLREQLAPLRDVVVWRLGLYYLLVFGGFVAIAQWLLPFSLNVYGLTVAGAGLVASVFSFPSGLIRAIGGWLSDRYGARPVMFWVFVVCVVCFAMLSVPRMEVVAPGEGVLAKAAGEVVAVSATEVQVGEKRHPVTPRPELDHRDEHALLPQIIHYQEPAVASGELVEKKQLLARGTTRVYYPANFWLYVGLVFVVGVATGIGKASVYKFIPDQYPNAVGAVGGLVGLIGGLGGFLLPLGFGWLLRTTGFWVSCFWVLTLVSVVCLVWMEVVARRIVQAEAPNLVRLMERGRETALASPISLGPVHTARSIEDVLRRVPLFASLSEEEVKSLARIGKQQQVKAGELIICEGEPGESLYVLLSGGAAVSQRRPDLDEATIALVRPGDFFGEIALLDGGPRTASVTASAPSELFVIGRTEFLALLQRSPRFLADVLLALSSKLRGGEPLPFPHANRGSTFSSPEPT